MPISKPVSRPISKPISKPISLCRVSIHTEGADGPTTTDLALPAALPLAMLLPSIVDLLAGSTTSPVRWRLSRIEGTTLDESMTLAENDVHDGNRLLLSAVQPPHAAADNRCLTEVVAETVPSRGRRHHLGDAVSAWAALASAFALVSTAGTPASGHLVTAAAICAVAAGFAIVRHRQGTCQRAGGPACVTIAVITVLFAAVSGFIAVPAGPSAANCLLAAAVAATVATLLLRITGCGTTYLTALTVASSIVAAGLAPAVVSPLPVQAIGAVLTTVALVVLGLAARISVAVSGLSPAPPTDDDAALGNDTDAENARLADRGHRVLTGVVVGSASAAALGAALVTWGCVSGPAWRGGAALTAVLGVALLLRARSHACGFCWISLAMSGICSLTATFVLVVAAAPAHAYWAGAVVAGAGAGVRSSAVHTMASPISRRAADLLEYVVLAAVVPLACLVAGLYSLARGWTLP